MHPKLGISLREKNRVYSAKLLPPHPLTEAGAGQSISKLIRLIWSTQGPAALTPARSTEAAASAATDWPDLSYSSSALIRTRSIKEILSGMISLPLLRCRAPQASSPAATVRFNLQRRL